MAGKRFANALYLTHSGGGTWVEDAGSIAAYGRVEDTESLGETDDPDTIAAIGARLLASRAWPLESVQLGLHTPRYEVDGTPMGDPVAGDDFTIYDTLTTEVGTQVCERITWSMAGDKLVPVPELATPSKLEQARTARAVERMIVEAGGRSAVSARPNDTGTKVTPGKVGTVEIPSWSWRESTDLDDTGLWQPWPSDKPGRLYEWVIACEAGTGTSIFEFVLDGAHDGLTNIVLAAGDTFAKVNLYGYSTFRKDSVLAPRCTTNGGHRNGSVTFRAADLV